MSNMETHTSLNEQLIDEADRYVRHYFDEHITDAYSYHNLQHTLDVSDRAYKIGEAEGISQQDLYKLKLAGLFHDLGYKEGAQGHEIRSAELAENWLRSAHISEEDISDIKRLIHVTKMGTSPTDLLEKIICDADIAHVGTKQFSKRAKALRSEKVLVEGKSYTDQEWIENNVCFLKNVSFHTSHARELFSARKAKNLKKLQKTLADQQQPKSIIEAKKLYKSIDGNKGVQTMFRTTLRNHNQLSKIADNKASIMLSISAIMLSIVVSTLAPKLDSNPHLMIPAVMVITVCMLTIIFSILSARP